METLAAAETGLLQLLGEKADLLELCIPVQPKLLEDILEALASLEFPVNPQLSHQPGVVHVEFPAYANHVEEIRKALVEFGLDPKLIQVSGVLVYEALGAA